MHTNVLSGRCFDEGAAQFLGQCSPLARGDLQAHAISLVGNHHHWTFATAVRPLLMLLDLGMQFSNVLEGFLGAMVVDQEKSVTSCDPIVHEELFITSTRIQKKEFIRMIIDANTLLEDIFHGSIVSLDKHSKQILFDIRYQLDTCKLGNG